jgi:hypothetical protein
MADSDPDLAAQLLAAFSAPTGALPVPDLSPLSYEGWHWNSCDFADLLSERKTEPQPEPVPAPESTEQEHTPPELHPEQPLKQEPSEQKPSEQEASQQQQQETLQVESSEKAAVPQEALPQAALPQETLPQQRLPQETSPIEQIPQPPTAPEPPSSPQKRSRSLSPRAENYGSIAEKRLKTDHHVLDHRDVDLSAANWDISAMIENALGSFDQQSHQPHTEHNRGAGDGSAPETSQAKSQAPRKVEQKRMKFSSNPYYVMRTMSLPLLGSLVSQCQCPWRSCFL